MELAPEPDVGTRKADECGKNNDGHFEPETAPISERATTEQVQQPLTPRRAWSVQHIDPIFFITLIATSGLFIIGLILFTTHSDRLIAAHVSEIESSRKLITEKIALTDLAEREEPSLITQSVFPKSVPTVTVQSHSQAVSDARHESITGNDSQTESDVVTSDEVIELRQLLAEKTQQLELLALENHELRLTVEFGHTDIRNQSALVSSEIATDAKITTYLEEATIAVQRDSIDYQTQEKAITDVSELISRADKALKNRDYVSAGSWFRSAVQQNPSSREANLGVASVALSKGNTALAIDRYRHLLNLNPGDQIAFSAMLDLAAPDNMLETELLGHSSRVATNKALFYSQIGHHFGGNGRWVEANAAYANALQSASPKAVAEILFNIGVSFEHLGSSVKAAEYYQQALDTSNNASLDLVLVQGRLNRLSQ